MMTPSNAYKSDNIDDVNNFELITSTKLYFNLLNNTAKLRKSAKNPKSTVLNAVPIICFPSICPTLINSLFLSDALLFSNSPIPVAMATDASAIAPKVANSAATIPNVPKSILIVRSSHSKSSEFSSEKPCAIVICSVGKMTANRMNITIRLAIRAIAVVRSSALALKTVTVNKLAPPISRTQKALNWKLINTIITTIIAKLIHRLIKAPIPLMPPIANIKTNKITDNIIKTLMIGYLPSFVVFYEESRPKKYQLVLLGQYQWH